MPKLIAVDIDNTVVNVGTGWFNDLESKYSISRKAYQFSLNYGKMPYDLTELFHIPSDEDGFAYFKNSRLYSGLKPIEGSVEVLRELKDKGFDICFVSRTVGDHSKSKCDWVHKWFPFVDGILLAGGSNHTKEKSFVKADYVIEDSLHQLNAFPDEVKKLHYYTPYYQVGVEPPKHNFILVHDWSDIRDYFETEESK